MKNKSIEELRYDPSPPSIELDIILPHLSLILPIAFLIMAFPWIVSLSYWTLYSGAPVSKSYCERKSFYYHYN